MNRAIALLRDRKRRQRGGVLSGVLFITAFLAIIAGALMTELSTNFLLSRVMVNRVATQATVDSAVELAIDQLQNTPVPIDSGCPDLTSPTSPINGQDATLTRLSCAPVVESGLLPLQAIDASNNGGFVFKGSHIVMSNPSRNEYLVASSGGTLFAYGFGSSTRLWSPVALGGSLTGPPTAVPDVSTNPRHISNLVPISNSCGPNPYCVAKLAEAPGSQPALRCLMPTTTNTRVVASPAAGVNFPNVVFFGDNNGRLYAYDHTENGNCALKRSVDVIRGGEGSPAIVAGPVVFQGAIIAGRKRDEIYFVTWDGSSSLLQHYRYTEDPVGRGFFSPAPIDAQVLHGSKASGLTIDQSALPARIAISFADGEMAVAKIQADYWIGVPISRNVSPGIADAPYWCRPCGDLIGAGGTNGTLYLVDTNLTPAATYAGSVAINTTPGTDTAGDWFFGADDGYVYEVQRVAGQSTMTLVDRFPTAIGSKIGSGVQVGSCGMGVCIYLGTRPGSVYLVPLAARRVVLTSCIGTAPACSPGVNPRLWARVEVGSLSSQQTVRVTGWSYYSP